MAHRTFSKAICLAALMGLVAFDAAAWGPRAQRAITSTAMQMIRRTYSSAFKATTENFDQDVINGALAGLSGLRDTAGLTTDERIMNRISSEMQLLREVRKYSPGSYFSYRMGVLSTMTADLFLPFALDTSPSGTQLARRIEADIDERLASFSFHPRRQTPTLIRDVREYVNENRPFFSNAEVLVAADYSRGDGYDGYLKRGAQTSFERAVQAVADVWYTVLYEGTNGNEVAPSDDSLTWYLVDEIDYMLSVKNNLKQAERTYSFFSRVNPGILSAYEEVGDLFYRHGARERGVREWETAMMTTGPDRQRIVRKLANYHIDRGKDRLLAAKLPDAPETTLTEALDAFEMALKIDGTSEVAMQAIHETKHEMRQRAERESTDIALVAAAESTLNEAKQRASQRKFGEALSMFSKAEDLFGNVTDEFPAQRETKLQGIKDAQAETRRVLNDILNQAQNIIEAADRRVGDAKAEDEFNKAKEEYQEAQSFLAQIPEGSPTTFITQKDDLIKQAKEKTETAEVEKQRWKENEERRKKMIEDREAAERAAAAAASSAATTTPPPAPVLPQ